MKRISQSIFVLVTLFLITKTLAQQPSNNLRASNSANLIAAPIATPVGGSSNGVIYKCCGGTDILLVLQKDLNDPTSVVPILTYEQLQERLAIKTTRVDIYSISPDGKKLYMWVYDPNKKLPAPYIASVDLNLLTHLSNSQYVSGGPFDLLWSPDGSALMGMAGMAAIILRPGKTRVKISAIQGNMLTWSPDSTKIYLNDGNNRLIIYNVGDGSKQRWKVGFVDKINHSGDSSKQESINDLSLSPFSDEMLFLTSNYSDSRITVYKSTSDFKYASVLMTFTGVSGCNPYAYQFTSRSPNGQYIWIFLDGCDSRIFNTTDGSAVWDKEFVLKDDKTRLRNPCGWSPDNYFVTFEYIEGTTNTLSFWDPSHPAKPVVNVPFSGYGCPVWLP